MHLDRKNIEALEQRYRAALINSITGFKSLALIGTENSKKQSNLAIFSSLVHLGAHPPLLGFIVRPDSVERHTLSNIEENGFYTINHIHESFYKSAHQTSARYPKEQSEFDACGIRKIYRDNFLAPFVENSPLQIGLEVRKIMPIELNQTILVIGEIQHLYFDETAIAEDGFVDLERLGSITCAGLDAYYTTKKIARLSYAKPDRPINER